MFGYIIKPLFIKVGYNYSFFVQKLLKVTSHNNQKSTLFLFFKIFFVSKAQTNTLKFLSELCFKIKVNFHDKNLKRTDSKGYKHKQKKNIKKKGGIVL